MSEQPASAIINPVWTISERNARNIPFERTFFVDLKGLKGDVEVWFELKVRLLNNRRDELPVWVKTNVLTVVGTP